MKELVPTRIVTQEQLEDMRRRRSDTVRDVLSNTMLPLVEAMQDFLPEEVFAFRLAVGSADFTDVDAERLRATLAGGELERASQMQHSRVAMHRSKLEKSSLIMLTDDQSPSGFSNKQVSLDEKHLFMNALDEIASSKPIPNQHDNITEEVARDMLVNALSYAVSKPVLSLVDAIKDFAHHNSVYDPDRNLAQVVCILGVRDPRIETVARRIKRLATTIHDFKRDPYSACVAVSLEQDKGFDERVDAAIDGMVCDAYGELYEQIIDDRRRRKRAAKLAGKTVAAEESVVISDIVDERAEPTRVDMRLDDVELAVAHDRKVVRSLWSEVPKEREVTAYQLHDKLLYVLRDYDPKLNKLARDTRKKHPVAKSAQHPYDRLVEKEAIALLTGALPIVYEGGSDTSKLVTRHTRSPDYADIEVRYARSRAHNSSRVYYVIKKASEVIEGVTDESIYCLMVVAETDKANEPRILQRIRGNGVASLRRGMG